MALYAKLHVCDHLVLVCWFILSYQGYSLGEYVIYNGFKYVIGNIGAQSMGLALPGCELAKLDLNDLPDHTGTPIARFLTTYLNPCASLGIRRGRDEFRWFDGTIVSNVNWADEGSVLTDCVSVCRVDDGWKWTPVACILPSGTGIFQCEIPEEDEEDFWSEFGIDFESQTTTEAEQPKKPKTGHTDSATKPTTSRTTLSTTGNIASSIQPRTGSTESYTEPMTSRAEYYTEPSVGRRDFSMEPSTNSTESSTETSTGVTDSFTETSTGPAETSTKSSMESTTKDTPKPAKVFRTVMAKRHEAFYLTSLAVEDKFAITASVCARLCMDQCGAFNYNRKTRVCRFFTFATLAKGVRGRQEKDWEFWMKKRE